jgi:tetratricopeptide (TPR) repeat protein
MSDVVDAEQALQRDYFTADEDPAAREQLNINNQHHTDQVLLWLRRGRIDRAIEDAKFTLQYWPNHPRALILMEFIARVARTPSLPIPYYEKAILEYPQHALTHAQYGKYLFEIEQVNDSIMHLKQAVELDPKLGAAHAWLGEAYAKSGSKDLARKAAEKARALGYLGYKEDTSGTSPGDLRK